VDTKAATVDEYISAQAEAVRPKLEHLRRTIKTLAPEAVEAISYGIPTYKYRGKHLAYFGAAKKHYALYGFNTEGHEAELAGYDTDKGTIRIPLEEQVPEALVKVLVLERMASVEATTKSSG
jgi:uncharacterized protein YdhG (YjbR/CyaY superfamily)